VAAGKKWVVDIDLKSFFVQVNHERLMTMIGRTLGATPDAENRTSVGVGALAGEIPPGPPAPCH
jgi:hypothetical protein